MRFHCLVPLLFAWMMALPPAAMAERLTMAPTLLAITLEPDASWQVTGSIANLTGSDLFSTDLFLTFSGYPHGALAPLQTLGNPDFLIADRGVTGPVDLFSLSLLPGAARGASYAFEVFALSLNGDLSNVSTFVVTVAAIPEPSRVATTAVGLLALLLCRALGHGRAGRFVLRNA